MEKVLKNPFIPCPSTNHPPHTYTCGRQIDSVSARALASCALVIKSPLKLKADYSRHPHHPLRYDASVGLIMGLQNCKHRSTSKAGRFCRLQFGRRPQRSTSVFKLVPSDGQNLCPPEESWHRRRSQRRHISCFDLFFALLYHIRLFTAWTTTLKEEESILLCFVSLKNVLS